MVYSITDIRTIEDCNVLLEMANFEKRDLDIRKLQNDKQYAGIITGTGSTGIAVDLIGVNAEIAGLQLALAGVAPGPEKESLENKLVKCNYKKVQLEERQDRYGILAKLQKEYEISCIEKELLENQTYVDELTQRKSQL